MHQELLPKEAVEYKEWQVYWLQQFLVSGLKKGNKNQCQILFLEIFVSLSIQQLSNLLSLDGLQKVRIEDQPHHLQQPPKIQVTQCELGSNFQNVQIQPRETGNKHGGFLKISVITPKINRR